MPDEPIEEERIADLNDAPVDQEGRYVLYWMQQDQRTRLNHALEFAVIRANELGRPLLVAFGLMDDYPEANLRHYLFMLQGLRDVSEGLRERGIRFVLRRGHPAGVAIELARDAAAVVTDRGVLRNQRAWRDRVADAAGVRVTQVETNLIVPVETASDKKEHAARTLRPKLHKLWPRFIKDLPPEDVRHPSLDLEIAGEGVSDPAALADAMKLDRSVPPNPLFVGGEREADRLLGEFFAERFSGYRDCRNQPQTDLVSHMSKYLHFGQVSPIRLVLDARGSDAPEETATRSSKRSASAAS